MTLPGVSSIDICEFARSYASDKNISLEDVMRTIEGAIMECCRARYGRAKLVARVNRSTGIITLYRELNIVENITECEDKACDILLNDARKIDEHCDIGGVVKEVIPFDISNRGTFSRFKKEFFHLIREVYSDRDEKEYAKRIGANVVGKVTVVRSSYVMLDLGSGAFGYLSRANQIPSDRFSVNDSVAVNIESTERTSSGLRINVSRANENFFVECMKKVVPEISRGIIEVKKCVRDAGYRTKVALVSHSLDIESVGSVVGVGGSRISEISRLCGGKEKIDVFEYNANSAEFAIKVMGNISVKKVVWKENETEGVLATVVIVVPDEFVGNAIGLHGKNVRLASKMLESSVTVLGESEYSNKRLQDMKRKSGYFCKALDIDVVMGNIIVLGNFDNVSDIANSSKSDISALRGFDDELAEEILSRAKEYASSSRSTGAGELLRYFDDNAINVLREKERVFNVKDLADLSSDELLYALDGVCDIDRKSAEGIIMSARNETIFVNDK